ncbi:hypothetical protein BDZ88DRAFT_210167 [Geranomyces variabilis]|nr:hypothetical protein BDZ88DRAFT_210167 [Geranomyces variabilis]
MSSSYNKQLDLVKVSRIYVPARKDNYPIAVTIYEPPPVRPSSSSTSPSSAPTLPPAVIINSATGCHRRFYDSFARYLAGELGCPTITWDYRGVGDSGSDRLRELSAVTIQDHWATRDQPAVTAHLHGLYPDREMVLFGNSVGCHIAPMNPERDLISRYIFVAGNNAYWRHHYQTWVTWFFPAGVEAFSFGRGYFPASIVKLCDDIPLGAARDWARWTHNSIYCTIEPHIKKVYDSFQPGTKQKPGAAIHVAFTDDELINKRTPTPIDAFGSWTALMTNAGVELMFLDPSAATDSGRAVGHLGFFRKHCRKGWDALAPFILDGTRPVFKENPAAAAAATSVKPIKAKL